MPKNLNWSKNPPDGAEIIEAAREMGIEPRGPRPSRDITDAEAIEYLNSIPESQRHNADCLIFGNRAISRERACDITEAWFRNGST